MRILLALSLSEFERSGLGAAQSPLESAIDAAIRSHDEEMVALGRSQHAMLLGRSGQIPAALTQLDLAMQHLDLLAPRDQWVVLLNRGMARSELRDLAGARRDFLRARDLARGHGLPRQEFMAAHNLGYAAYLAGDMPEAMTRMAEAEHIESDVSPAAARLDRGRLLLEAGLVSEAAEVLTEAVALCTDRRQDQLRGEAELELSRAQSLLGDLDAAEQSAGAARRRFARRATPLWAERAQLERLQIQLSRRRRPGHVEHEAAELASWAQDRGDVVLQAHASLLAAEAAHVRLDKDAAASHVRGAESLRRTGSLSTRLRLDLIDANLAAAGGDAGQARRILRRAARDLRTAQSGSASLDLRTARSLHGMALTELDISLSLAGGAPAVLASTERWRNASASLPEITPPEDAVLAGWLTELRGIQERLRSEQLSAADRVELREEHGRIQRRIRLRDWTSRAGKHTAATTSTTIDDVRRELTARHTDLVSYFSYQDDLYSVTLVSGRARLNLLGPLLQVLELTRRVHADLQALALHGAGPMGPAITASLRGMLGSLDQLLLQGIPTARPLVAVPTTRLALLPWGMLPSRRGLPTTVAGSATAWAHRPRQAAARPAAVAIAGPDLPLAAEEVRRVSGLWNGTSTPPSRSTAAGLREAFASADIVHVAAHGRHEQENPLFSSLRLADGPMFAHELANTGVRAAHVVLSACDVGRSTVRPGDEALGLTAGLLQLGATSVVAPVCRVPDHIAARTMVRYHRGLSRGLDAAESLADAADGPHLLASAFTLAGSPFRVLLP